MSEVSTQRTIAAWNIFLDRDFPQEHRAKEIQDAIARLEPTPDVVGLMEVDMRLAAGYSMGQPSLWTPHSRKKLHEGIGVYGPGVDVEGVELIDLGFKKTALLVKLGDTATIFAHLKRPQDVFDLSEQREQTGVLIEVAQDYKKVAIIGDMNSLRWQGRNSPRRELLRAGFTSVYSLPGVARPYFPADSMRGDDEYARRLRKVEKLGLKVARRLVQLDDCYIRGDGLKVVTASTQAGASDHPLLLVTLEGVA